MAIGMRLRAPQIDHGFHHPWVAQERGRPQSEQAFRALDRARVDATVLVVEKVVQVIGKGHPAEPRAGEDPMVVRPSKERALHVRLRRQHDHARQGGGEAGEQLVREHSRSS
eukprot:scaffold17393_cov54-Phaeocystis_antarctica.AAC.2